MGQQQVGWGGGLVVCFFFLTGDWQQPQQGEELDGCSTGAPARGRAIFDHAH
jgi:hypothetical protein